MQDTDGNTYYLKSAPAFGDLTKIEYWVGFNGEASRVDLRRDKLVALKPTAAPHQELANKVRSTFRNATIDHWRENIQDVVETLLKADKVDPFLRYLLVLKTAEFGGRGDRFLEIELATLREKLTAQDIDRSVPWMDPKNKAALSARNRALEILATIPVDSVEQIFAAASKRQAEFERLLFSPRFAVGWIEKQSQDQWGCRTKWSVSGEYSLYVVSRPDASGARTWLQAGVTKGNSFAIDPVVAQAVGEATVVFASPNSADAKTAFVTPN